MKRNLTTMLLVGVISLLFPCLVFGASQPPLYKAAMAGDIKKVTQLVEKGTDINAGAYGWTPLEAAASNGHLDVVEYLLSKGAQSPQKAYSAAFRNKHDAVIKFLLDNGYVDINNNATDFYSYLNEKDIPFEQRMQNVKDITGGKLNSPTLLTIVEPENYQKVIDFFGIKLTDKADAFGGSILHVAARRNNYDLIKYLLDRKFNINALDNNNQTALFYAITVFGPSIDWENPVIEDATTAKIKFTSDMPYYGNPRAVQQNQVRIVTALLDGGINVNQQNKAGWTVLHFAAAFYPDGLQELLVSKGAKIDLKTIFGRTAADIRVIRK